MRAFIEYVIKNLVADPDGVEVKCRQKGAKNWIVEMRVAEDDIGKVIGKGGQTIKALRLLALTVGSRIGQRVQVQLISE
jgi:predicted RNA-binding protein YlqC (UPF0109 family)